MEKNKLILIVVVAFALVSLGAYFYSPNFVPNLQKFKY
jgi:hypothetical protein